MPRIPAFVIAGDQSKTAKARGLLSPPSVLARATGVGLLRGGDCQSARVETI